jgi:MraZ protein
MAAFKGSYRYTIDHKGRVNIPAKFRRSTASTSHDLYVITRGLEGCLFVYPAEEWERVEEKLRNLSFTQKSHRLFARHLLSNACDAQLDRQGRITIPQNLLEFAQIKKEVLIFGLLERIEIWDTEVHQEYLNQAGKTYEEIAEEIYFKE